MARSIVYFCRKCFSTERTFDAKEIEARHHLCPSCFAKSIGSLPPLTPATTYSDDAAEKDLHYGPNPPGFPYPTYVPPSKGNDDVPGRSCYSCHHPWKECGHDLQGKLPCLNDATCEKNILGLCDKTQACYLPPLIRGNVIGSIEAIVSPHEFLRKEEELQVDTSSETLRIP